MLVSLCFKGLSHQALLCFSVLYWLCWPYSFQGDYKWPFWMVCSGRLLSSLIGSITNYKSKISCLFKQSLERKSQVLNLMSYASLTARWQQQEFPVDAWGENVSSCCAGPDTTLCHKAKLQWKSKSQLQAHNKKVKIKVSLLFLTSNWRRLSLDHQTETSHVSLPFLSLCVWSQTTNSTPVCSTFSVELNYQFYVSVGKSTETIIDFTGNCHGY